MSLTFSVMMSPTWEPAVASERDEPCAAEVRRDQTSRAAGTRDASTSCARAFRRAAKAKSSVGARIAGELPSGVREVEGAVTAPPALIAVPVIWYDVDAVAPSTAVSVTTSTYSPPVVPPSSETGLPVGTSSLLPMARGVGPPFVAVESVAVQAASAQATAAEHHASRPYWFCSADMLLQEREIIGCLSALPTPQSVPPHRSRKCRLEIPSGSLDRTMRSAVSPQAGLRIARARWCDAP